MNTERVLPRFRRWGLLVLLLLVYPLCLCLCLLLRLTPAPLSLRKGGRWELLSFALHVLVLWQ